MPPFGRLISALLLLAAACLLDRSSKLLTMAPPTSSAPACSGSQEQNKKEKQWDGSEAKKLVYQYLKAGTIPCDGSIPPSVIWRTHFKDHPLFVDRQSYDRFRDRFLSLRKLVSTNQERAKDDDAALLHDRQFHPVPLLFKNKKYRGYPQGYPRWRGHSAETLLKQHVDDGLHKAEGFRPMQLRLAHAAYMEFPLEVFRKHLDQELQSRKFIDQYCKANYYPNITE